jgi:hypothetical protein
MSPSAQKEELVKAIGGAIVSIGQNGPLIASVLVDVLCQYLAVISHKICSQATSMNHLTFEEQMMMSHVTKAIKPFFEAKR